MYNKLIYVGPSLISGELTQYQIFEGGIPACLDDLVMKHPQIEKLFVTVDELVEARIQVRKPGTTLNKYYKETMEVNR